MDDSMKSLSDAGQSSETPKKREKLSVEEANARRLASNTASRKKLLAANPSYFTDYAKRRKEAIKAGTWAPRRKKAAQVLPDTGSSIPESHTEAGIDGY